MALELLTLHDLYQFKKEFFQELKMLLIQQEKAGKLLKSKDVCKILGLSPGKLQKLRDDQIIKSEKLGSTLYYAYDDVTRIKNKLTGQSS